MKILLRFVLSIAALALLGWGFSGCLISGIFSINYVFEHDIHTSSQTSWGALDEERAFVKVDLNEESAYRDHRDKFKSVESVCLIMDVKENRNSQVSGEIWIAYDSLGSKAEVIDPNSGAKRIFSGIALQPNDTLHFGCGDIQEILENPDALEDAVKEGTFWVYGFGHEDEYDVTFYNIVLIINMAAGL